VRGEGSMGVYIYKYILISACFMWVAQCARGGGRREVGSSTKCMHLKVQCLCKEFPYDENGNYPRSMSVSFPPKNRK
jgi:hypothetical protein